MIEYKGYVAEQTDNHHVYISKEGRTCLHASAERPLTEAELREMIEQFMPFLEDPKQIDQLPDVEEI